MSANDMIQHFLNEVLKPVITAAVTEAVKESLEEQNSKPMTISEAADFLRVSEKTIYRYIQDGKITFRKKGGKRLLNREDIEAEQEKKETSRIRERKGFRRS